MEWNDSILAENVRRKAAILRQLPDPLAPKPGIDDDTRMRTDFEYWAARCVRIRHKTTGMIVPFVLNRAQRKVLAELERQRTAAKPVRLIVLKSRQWGCSTLIVHYMAWIQLMHRENWNSLICAHVRDAATQLRALYHDLVANYPDPLTANRSTPNESTPLTAPRSTPNELKFGRFRGLASVSLLQPCNARVGVCSALNPDSARGADYSMAHLSEVAYWPDSAGRSSMNLVRAVCSSIPRVPGSVVVMESTANGAGGFFYQEWCRAQQGLSDKAAVFAPWYEVDMNSEELTIPARELWQRLDDYERSLWHLGVTLEQINWYHNKTLESGGSRLQMMREHPSTPAEAFSNSLPPVFEPEKVEEQRLLACEPLRTAEVNPADGSIIDSPAGRLQIWKEPCAAEELTVSGGYIAAVDVGGNWEGADWSVVAVFDCRTPGRMELAAQWRGHVDVDRLCTIASVLGRRYHSAMLVVESNSVEARGTDALERLAAAGYPNLYRRRILDAVTGAESFRYGFYTNRETKAAAITDLIAALRDGTLVERSISAVEELATYVRTPRGNTEATHGCHDDLVMTRAIAAYALRQHPPRPRKHFLGWERHDVGKFAHICM